MIVLKILSLFWIALKALALAPLMIQPAWWLCLLVIANFRPILQGWRLTNQAKVKA